MKENSFFAITLLSVLLASTSCQNTVDWGLVAYYPFTAGADDWSGKGQNGVVDGAVLIEDRYGNKNSAYLFDGISGTILVKVSQLPAVNEAQSISWWYRNDSIPEFSDEWGAGNMIALVDSAKGIGIQFGFRGPAYRSLGLDTWNWGGGTLLESEPPPVQMWHHCVYTFDGIVHRFFIDGQIKAQSTAKTQQGIPTRLMFGNYPSGDQYFSGRLDDIRIYNREITESELNRLYHYQD